MTNLLQYSKEKKIEVANQFLVTFKNSNNYFEISRTLIKFSKDLENLLEIIDNLTKSNCFMEAAEISCEFNSLNTYSEQILSGVKLAYMLKMNEIKSQKDLLDEKNLRLQLVQLNKKNMPQILAGTGHKFDSEIMSTSEYSVSETSNSGLSKSSNKSRKRSRKIKRKVIKEGSLFEEEYLVKLINSLSPTQAFLDEVEKLSEAMKFFGLVDEFNELLDLLNQWKMNTSKKMRTLEQQSILEKYSLFFDKFPEFNPNSLDF